MLGAIYTGLSGMSAYSQGLDVISNNVANLNTPGFKVSDPMFREIVYQNLKASGGRDSGQRPSGAGVEVDAASMSFRQGDLRDTGNALDAAVDGNGFFVLELDGEYRYSRAGQFQFNKDGILVDRDTGARVLMSTLTAAETSFDLNSARVFDPRATQQVALTGVLARGGTATTYDLPNITVYDAGGGSSILKAKFARDATNPLTWGVEILNVGNDVIGSGTIEFDESGRPVADKSSVTATVDPANAEAFDVRFNFGAPGTFSGVTSNATSTTSQVQVLKQDGLQIGSLTQTQFDEKGQLKLTYSNGETRTVGTLLLAQFDAPEQLQSLGRSIFAATGSVRPVLGGALTAGLGRVVGGRVELSNVELTDQFTDLIIIQRGYQASSQITSIANEMIQQLLAMESGR
jgi:flagellar hook protein FlgE